MVNHKLQLNTYLYKPSPNVKGKTCNLQALHKNKEPSLTSLLSNNRSNLRETAQTHKVNLCRRRRIALRVVIRAGFLRVARDVIHQKLTRARQLAPGLWITGTVRAIVDRLRAGGQPRELRQRVQVRQLVQHGVARGGKPLINAGADVGVAVGGALAAPALHGGVVVAPRGVGGGVGGVVDEILGAGAGPELRARLDDLLVRGASWGGIGHEAASIRAVGDVGALELNGIVAVGAGDACHHVLKMSELNVG